MPTVGQTIVRWPLVESHVRADGGEVGERLRVDLGQRRGAPLLDHRAQRR